MWPRPCTEAWASHLELCKREYWCNQHHGWKELLHTPSVVLVWVSPWEDDRLSAIIEEMPWGGPGECSPVKTSIVFKCSWNLVTKETLLNYWKISFGVSSFGRSVFFLFRNAIWHGQVVILWHEQTSLPWPLRTVIPRIFLQKCNQEIQFCAGEVLPPWWNTATSPEKQSFKIFLLITQEFHTLNFGHLQPSSLQLFQMDHPFHTQPTLCPHFLFKNYFS